MLWRPCRRAGSPDRVRCRAERGELVEVCGPLGQHEAVPSSARASATSAATWRGPCVVGGQVFVDRGDPAGSGRVGVAGVAERGSGARAGHGLAGVRVAEPDVEAGLLGQPGRSRSGLRSAEWVMVCRIGPSCSAIRSSSLSRRYGRGGQPEPAPGWDLPDSVLERRCRDVVAFVGDHQPVSGGKRWRCRSRRARVCRVTMSMMPLHLRAAAAELPGLDPEVVTDAGPPLVGQCLAVYQHECGRAVARRSTAQAITVLPEPGGATSTPRSWLASALAAALLLGGRGWP